MSSRRKHTSRLLSLLLILGGGAGLFFFYLWVWTDALGWDLPKTALLR